MFEKLFRKKEGSQPEVSENQKFTEFTHQILSLAENGKSERALEMIKFEKMVQLGKAGVENESELDPASEEAKLIAEINNMERMVIAKLEAQRKQAA